GRLGHRGTARHSVRAFRRQARRLSYVMAPHHGSSPKSMKHPRLAVAAMVMAGVFVAFVLVRPSSSGPSYEGESAAHWLKVYRTFSIAEQEDARDAFKALGDRAVPYLLSVLSRPHRMRWGWSYANLRSALTPPLQRGLPSVSTEDT